MELKPFNIDEYKAGQNLYIDASAGTGKTYTIQQLVAKLVEGDADHAPIQLSKILLVTYTEKATGELRDRIRKKMEDCLAEREIAGNKTAELFRNALQEVHNAPIFTIHSFCQNTLKNFAYEANVPLTTNVTSDDGISTLVEKSIRDEWPADPDFLACTKDIDISTFVKKCIRAVELFRLAENVKVSLCPRNFDELLAQFDEYRNHFDVLKANKTLVNSKGKGVAQFVEVLEEWRGGSLFNKKTFPQKTWVDCGWGNQEVDCAMAFFFENQKALEDMAIKPADSFILNHVQELSEKWEAYKAENRLQSFANMIHGLHSAIVKSDALVEKLRDTYTYAIIDEFQDTNQLQWDIFKTVFLDSKRNALVVVGDPKQSIFSFQGTDLDVYRNAVKEIGIANGRILNTNFRSSDSMIKACNELFEEGVFSGSDFTESSTPKDGLKKMPATLNGEVTKPLWISEKVSEKGFARYAVAKIMECCTFDKTGKTALQVFDKDQKAMRNVRFSDFAVLSRSRSEIFEIEKIMGVVGIPFSRYKDKTLFNGEESFSWISLLKAIDADDFAGYNRKILNQALFTEFFGIGLEDVENEEVTEAPLRAILRWQILARNRQWAELQECIYKDTEVEKRLCVPSKLQSLAKLRQIGAYVFDYLYNSSVSLEEAIQHLENVRINSSNAEDEDGTLVAKGSDFDAVSVMTIYASKGLAFPVVIVAGASHGFNNNDSGPFLYRTENGRELSFHTLSKGGYREETFKEWRRLMYVACTRAESLMILPRFHRGTKEDSKPHDFAFFDARVDALLQSGNFVRPTDDFEKWKSDDGDLDYRKWNFNLAKQQVREILANMAETTTEIGSKAEQAKVITDLQNSIGDLSIYQYSYSSLSKKKKTKEDGLNEVLPHEEFEVTLPDDNRIDKDGSVFTLPVNIPTRHQIEIDSPAGIVRACKNYDVNAVPEKIKNYPKGAKLGNALHESFERIDFETFGQKSLAEAVADPIALAIIEERFVGQSLPIKRNPAWGELTANFIWNTLNAELPEIHGSVVTGKNFKLNSLPAADRRAEMDFHMSAQYGDWMNRFCKGFMDLLFVRRDENGNEYYSILDWKSDVLEDDQYSSETGVEEKVTEEYSVQRVLYSYCLIQWLHGFKQNLSPEEIFDRHFGGVYYAFARGCKACTCNGIYAQTWNSYEDLKNSFKRVLDLMGT